MHSMISFLWVSDENVSAVHIYADAMYAMYAMYTMYAMYAVSTLSLSVGP